MSLATIAIQNRSVTYFTALLILIGGITSFFSLGQLEDPEFTVKTATILTTYDGASAKEVELEVTDKLEIALQEMQEVDTLKSFSRAGLSYVEVDIKAEYWSDRLPQVWDKLRRKIRDIEGQFPSGVGRPDVGDDFGDVFGFQLAVTGDGFNYRQLEDYAESIKKELSLVDGVARVDTWGVQQRVIYIDVSQTQLSQLGITAENIQSTLQNQNAVVDAGSLDLATKRLRIAPSGTFITPEDIGNLTIRADANANNSSQADEIIRIRDIGTVVEGYENPPQNIMRFNGLPSIGLSLSNAPGINIVDMGVAVEKRLEELQARLPIGIEVSKVHWQSDVVRASVNSFLESFALAVLIVIAVLTVFMGLKLSSIIGLALVFTILISFILMSIFDIALQRMSLGALIIALGMMVDNAIVVADGYLVRVQRGMDRQKAAIEAADLPAWPLLGATIVAVMAFYPIYASTENVGEYCATLFSVIAISLLASWVVSVTLTPISCMDLLTNIKGDADKDPYNTSFYLAYRSFLVGAIRVRWLTLFIMIGALVVSIAGFSQVKQLFFPESSMNKFMIDLWLPEGSRIQSVSASLKEAEKKVLADKRVAGVATYIGSGPPRFYLPVSPEKPYSSYGQLIVNVSDFRDIGDLMSELTPWFQETYPDAFPVLRRFGVGPSNTWKVAMRISGPAETNPDELRAIGNKMMAIVNDEPLAAYVRSDWRQRIKKLVPEYNQERARWSSVSRENLADTTKRAFDGLSIGTYRDGDELIAIKLRQVEEERKNIGALDTLQIQPDQSTDTVPLGQVIDKVATAWEDPLIWRRDRRRTIIIQTNPAAGVTAPTLRQALLPKIEAVQLPPGYTLEWGGDAESTADSNASLAPGMVPAVALIAFIVVALFNAFKPPLIILCTIPFAVIGITAGLLLFDVPFGFLALLGGMSLAGMMIKNAIVLLDEIDIEIAKGAARYDAVIVSALSRLRPVMMTAATTVLGVVPLLSDVFWVGLAVTIMGGLTVGSFLTMVLLPVLYSIFYNVKRDQDEKLVVGQKAVQGAV
ncbi:MAG: efflux RND transporter permease subunit [Pseudomonadota bacterium]